MKFPLNLPDYSVIEVPKTYTAIIYGMVSVYSTLKTITPIDEMAEVFDVVGGNFLLSKPQLLEKIMKATILCKLDYDTGTRKMHLQAFNFLKIPKLFLYMFETLKSITKEDIIEAIDNICKEVFMLNSIDAKMNENIIKIMCQEFVKIGLMSQESLQKYIDIRKKDYLKEKGVLLALVDSEDLTIPPVINSDQIKQLISNLSESNNNTALPILTSLIEGGGEIFDALCASYLTEEQIYEFSYKLIMLNVLNEPFLGGDDEDKKMRSSIFDITFLCLTRLRYFHKDLRLVKLVGIGKNEDLEKSTFYKWNNNYVNHEYERISIDSASTPTADPVKLNTLQCGKPFWTITDHYGEMIEKIPDIGYTLWKEFSNPKVNEKEMRICLISFHQMPCFFVCLIHWLDTQNLAPAKKLFVKIIKSILPGNEITDPEARERWMFAVSAIKRVLEDMIKETQPRPYIGHMNITTTENFLPMPSHNEIPDVVLFRISFQQSSRRGFLNPNAAEIINQRMITNGIEDWCALGIDEIFNGQTMDDALASIETMIVSAFCNLTVCLAELARNLVDYMLRPDIYCMSIAQPYSMCLARLLHRVMAILIWANEYRLRKTPLEDDAFGVDPIMRTFDIILKRFYKETLTGHLKPTVSFIVGFLYEVAIAPTTEQHLKLIKLFEKNLFFNIVKLEPTQASFEVFLKIFGMDEDPKYGIVQYATLLQRRNGFELPINFLTAPPVTEKSEQTLGEEEMEFSNKSVQDEHHFEIEQ
uniref:Mediator of RNA polymerase II transcription subunit 24 n=1 Tax=Rhabditophanes sp. KR3021 TaxID=114890 RepID=A0AC35TJL9_9BILA